MKRIISILICFCLAFTGCISGTFASEGNAESNLFSDRFAYETADAMMEGDIWGIEDVRRTDALPPALGNGVLSLKDKQSVRFNWTKVTGVGQYNPASTYTFTFDVKLKDKGDGSIWTSGAATRALYVGFGGWYNLVELNDNNGNVKVGSNIVPYNDALFLEKDLHVVVNWRGGSISVDVFDETGKALISGQRSGSMFTDMTGEYEAMTNLVLRCEDGAVEVDNFAFQVKRSEPVSVTTLNPGVNQQAIFQCDLNYDSQEMLHMALDDRELLYLEDGNLRLGGKTVKGSYKPGTYKLKVYVNHAQGMTSVELISPDGSVVRRGYASLTGRNNLYGYAGSKDAYRNSSVSYEAVSLNDYQLTSTAPVYTGFDANVYNLVTSFDQAQSTRNFAWTAKTAFLQGASMELQYRAVGETTWKSVAAIKETESVDTVDEDYFKCDLTDLKADTTYEYKLGKTGSTSDWSKVYSFRTAPDSMDEFTFVAIGDTQGATWNGDCALGEATYREAFEAVPNPAFLMHTGDVVQTGSTQALWNMYFKILGAYGASTPLFATMGNHDALGDIFYFDYHFNHPNNGGKKALDSSALTAVTNPTLQKVIANADETIYSYDYGNAHFVVLNSGAYLGEDKALLEAQRQWLIQDLEANKDAKWKILMFHEPVYHRLGGAESRPWLYDVIEGYGVDLVLQGHSHLSTRTYPMKNGAIATRQNPDDIEKGIGTVYTTIGSTNPHHDGNGDSGHVEEILSLKMLAADQPTYTTVTVGQQKLTFVTKQVNGLVVDEFTITDKGTTEDKDSGPETDQVPAPEVHKCSYKSYITKATTKKSGKIVKKCSCGKIKSSVIIRSIKSVKLSKTAFVCNGKSKKPIVTVRNSKGQKINKEYYIVTYKNNKKIGKATVTVKFKERYKGTITKTFTIKPTKPAISKLSTEKKSITVKWKRSPKLQTTGYQVQIATNKKFTKNKKAVTVKGYKKTLKKIKNLKNKKLYYVKVRTYKTVKGVKYYSDWSKVKALRVK